MSAIHSIINDPKADFKYVDDYQIDNLDNRVEYIQMCVPVEGREYFVTVMREFDNDYEWWFLDYPPFGVYDDNQRYLFSLSETDMPRSFDKFMERVRHEVYKNKD